MANLVLPQRVTIQLADKEHHPLRVPNVLFRITAFASRKNDFRFQPFASTAEGVAVVVKQEIEDGIADCYDAGVMDYAHISECSASVEIALLTEQDIARAIEARNVWRKLLVGERRRWDSLEQLLDVYRNSNNGKLAVGRSLPMRVTWNELGAEYSYNYVVVPKS